MTPTVAVTAVSAFIGFILNSTVFYLVLSKGRQFYHYLFAGVLFICALWDLGIVLAMLRNEHPVLDQKLLLGLLPYALEGV